MEHRRGGDFATLQKGTETPVFAPNPHMSQGTVTNPLVIRRLLWTGELETLSLATLVTLQTERGWVGTPGEHATSLAALERGLGSASAPSPPLVLAPPVRRRIQSSLKAVAWNVVASILKQKQETKQTMTFTQSLLLLLLLLQLLEVFFSWLSWS